MFAKLLLSIKGEMATFFEDLNYILRRLEGTEEQLDSQAVAINELKDQMAGLEKDHRDTLYWLEDQENRNRRGKIYKQKWINYLGIC